MSDDDGLPVLTRVLRTGPGARTVPSTTAGLGQPPFDATPSPAAPTLDLPQAPWRDDRDDATQTVADSSAFVETSGDGVAGPDGADPGSALPRSDAGLEPDVGMAEGSGAAASNPFAEALGELPALDAGRPSELAPTDRNDKGTADPSHAESMRAASDADPVAPLVETDPGDASAVDPTTDAMERTVEARDEAVPADADPVADPRDASSSDTTSEVVSARTVIVARDATEAVPCTREGAPAPGPADDGGANGDAAVAPSAFSETEREVVDTWWRSAAAPQPSVTDVAPAGEPLDESLAETTGGETPSGSPRSGDFVDPRTEGSDETPMAVVAAPVDPRPADAALDDADPRDVASAGPSSPGIVSLDTAAVVPPSSDLAQVEVAPPDVAAIDADSGHDDAADHPASADLRSDGSHPVPASPDPAVAAAAGAVPDELDPAPSADRPVASTSAAGAIEEAVKTASRIGPATPGAEAFDAASRTDEPTPSDAVDAHRDDQDPSNIVEVSTRTESLAAERTPSPTAPSDPGSGQSDPAEPAAAISRGDDTSGERDSARGGALDPGLTRPASSRTPPVDEHVPTAPARFPAPPGDAATVPADDARSRALFERVRDAVLDDLGARVDMEFDARIAQVVHAEIEASVARLQHALRDHVSEALRDVVARAIAAEAARQRALDAEQPSPD